MKPGFWPKPAKPGLKSKHDFLYADVEARSWELTESELRLMLRHGLDPVRQASAPESSDIVFLEIAFTNQPNLLRLVLDSRADWGKERAIWREAIEHAHGRAHTEIARMLEVPADDRQTNGLHTAALNVLVDLAGDDTRFQHTFVSFNGSDPPDETMKLIRVVLPRACNLSLLKETPNKLSSYSHARTGKPGNLVQLRLVSASHGYDFYIRQSTGPAMAGSGRHGKLEPYLGHWIITNSEGWEE